MPEEAVTEAETVVVGKPHVITLLLAAFTNAVVISEITVTLAVAVQSLLWVTVTV